MFNIWCLLTVCSHGCWGRVRNKGFSKTDNEISVAVRQTVYLSVCWFIGLSNYASLQTSSRWMNVNNICGASQVFFKPEVNGGYLMRFWVFLTIVLNIGPSARFFWIIHNAVKMFSVRTDSYLSKIFMCEPCVANVWHFSGLTELV